MGHRPRRYGTDCRYLPPTGVKAVSHRLQCRSWIGSHTSHSALVAWDERLGIYLSTDKAHRAPVPGLWSWFLNLFSDTETRPQFVVSCVTPSDACGLGRAPSSAKGWVLAMLARKGELRVALGPAQGRAFHSGRLCPAKETAPEGADAGTTPAGPPGQREGSKS
jgi:hypothetical protein